MKRRRFFVVFIVLCLFLPGVIVLAFGIDKKEVHTYDNSFVVYAEGEKIDSERFIILTLAGYAEPDSKPETLKAMAVILRTNLRKKLAGRRGVSAEELGFHYYTEKELENIWGREEFINNYRKLEMAVLDTKNVVILNSEGSYIDALFHRASAGVTRDGACLGEEYEYLCAVKSEGDITADNYMQIVILEEEEIKFFLNKCFKLSLEEEIEPLAQKISIKNEDGGYVEGISVCGHEISVDEFASVLGLQSPAFYFEEYENKIRFFVSGMGHGFGLSIAGAEALAKEGYGYKDILKYYYTNIIIKYE